jgi:hypothetical protein
MAQAGESDGKVIQRLRDHETAFAALTPDAAANQLPRLQVHMHQTTSIITIHFDSHCTRPVVGHAAVRNLLPALLHAAGVRGANSLAKHIASSSATDAYMCGDGCCSQHWTLTGS